MKAFMNSIDGIGLVIVIVLLVWLLLRKSWFAASRRPGLSGNNKSAPEFGKALT